MHRIYVALVAFATALVSFSGVSLAASAADPADGSADAAKAIYDAFTGGHAAYAAALTLVLVVALARKYLGGSQQWLHTDAGAALTVLLGSFGTALSAALTGGGALTFHMAWTSACVAFAATGGYSAVKKLVIEPLLPKLPAQLATIVGWLFQHASDPSLPKTPVVAGNTGSTPSVS